MRPLLWFATALALLPWIARGEEEVTVAASNAIEVIHVSAGPPEPIEMFHDAAGAEWVSDEEIATIPATDAAGVIENLAGIRTQQRIQGEEAAVSIEGMPPEYTLLLVDGERWSGEIGGVGDASDIPLQNAERIEVLRGGQGARYGGDAGSGIIHLVTRDAPSDGFRVRADGAGGSDEKALGGMTAATRLGPVGLSLSGEYDQIAGFDEPSDPDIVGSQLGGEDSLHRQYFLYGRWDAPLGNAISLRGNGLWRVEDDDYVPEDLPEDLRKKDTNWRANVGADWLPFARTQASGDLTWYAIETDSQVGREFVLDEDEWKGETSAEHELETGAIAHTLFGGVELTRQNLRLHEGSLASGIENPELAADRRQNESFLLQSIFVRSESALTRWLTLELGGRARFHSDFDTRVLPQAGLLIEPTPTLDLRASWGLNYRTPSLRDLHQPPTAQLGGAYFLSGNPDLDPETSMTTRAGFEWTPARWLSLASGGFYNDIDDHIRSRFGGNISIGTSTQLVDPSDLPPEFLIPLTAICEAQWRFFPDPADWTPQCVALFNGEPFLFTFEQRRQLFVKSNLDSVQTWGIETQLRLRPVWFATLAIDYTWLRTRVSDSGLDLDELPNEAEHAVNVRGVVTAPWTDTQLSAAVRWRSGVIPERSGTGLITFADASDRTDDSVQVDLRVTQPLFGKLRFYVDVLNVTDERRWDSYAVRGRSLVAGVSGTFEGPL
jgi:outer membrane receptor for ferrienterochelin and colicins